VPLRGSYDDVLTLGEINRRYPVATRGAVASPQRVFALSIVGTVVIGLIGGSIGLALGFIITSSINASTAGQNLELFLLTPTLAIGALLFAVILGGLAGVIPAFSAARLDPVVALRSQ
jgi:putative ABC transport system permease protein